MLVGNRMVFFFSTITLFFEVLRNMFSPKGALEKCIYSGWRWVVRLPVHISPAHNVLSKLVENPRAEETQTGFNNVNGVID